MIGLGLPAKGPTGWRGRCRDKLSEAKKCSVTMGAAWIDGAAVSRALHAYL